MEVFFSTSVFFFDSIKKPIKLNQIVNRTIIENKLRFLKVTPLVTNIVDESRMVLARSLLVTYRYREPFDSGDGIRKRAWDFSNSDMATLPKAYLLEALNY